MADDPLRYDKMVEGALRDVVRQALTHVAERGLPGDHHFYITFETGHRGVEIPDHLRAQYKDEMTIVLQHQFYGLEVEERRFAVTLSFNRRPERLVIPLTAIRTFADPSVNFALQFQAIPTQRPRGPAPEAEPTDSEAEPPAGDADKGDKIVSLDSFRKK